jgi:hypothetical protein
MSWSEIDTATIMATSASCGDHGEAFVSDWLISTCPNVVIQGQIIDPGPQGQ